MSPRGAEPSGQVLVIVALGIVILLAMAGIAVDIGRLMAERRHLQNAADAAALAACHSLTTTNLADAAAAEQRAREVASVNLAGSPAGAVATMATPAAYDDQDGSGFLDADELVSGVVVSPTSARVAISADLPTTLARVVGVSTLGVGARAQCTLTQEPALPIVARRYAAPPGPGGGFVDVLATEATSTLGAVDPNPRGYGGVRTPAGNEVGQKGPLFEIYGVESKAHNSSEFRGFINLDIRDFRDVTERDTYNGADLDDNENTMKAEQAAYVIDGYPGPAFPAAVDPPSGDLQVATLSGHNTGHLLDAFDDVYDPGDTIMLAVYDGTVRAIPDFSITPPSRITLPATTASTDGPTFTVSRNDEFTGAVSLQLLGDAEASDPAHNILPTTGTGSPASGNISEPTFNPDDFTFASNQSSRSVEMDAFKANAVPAGIYTVWLKGTSSTPSKARWHPVPVFVGGATKGYHLTNSQLSGSAAALGDTISLTARVRTDGWQTGAPATQVSLSWDPDSLSDCLLNPVAQPAGMTVSFGSTLVTPSGGQGTASAITVDTDGLAAGCYMFTIRATATNRDNQPVVRLATATIYVAAEPSDGSYVEIIGFSMFEIESVDANTIRGRAIGPICADPNCAELRLVQRPRLIPWT